MIKLRNKFLTILIITVMPFFIVGGCNSKTIEKVDPEFISL